MAEDELPAVAPAFAGALVGTGVGFFSGFVSSGFCGVLVGAAGFSGVFVGAFVTVLSGLFVGFGACVGFAAAGVGVGCFPAVRVPLLLYTNA